MRISTKSCVFSHVLLLLLLSGVYSKSSENTDRKIEALERKLQILSASVLSMTSENEHLKERVTSLENIIRNSENYDGGEGDAFNKKAKNIMEKPEILKNVDRIPNGKEEKGGAKEIIMFVESHSMSVQGPAMVRKRIEHPTSMSTGVIAFHAYLSKDSSGPLPANHILKFDVVAVNKRHGYNRSDGIFITPVSGTYVFTWAIMSHAHGSVRSQLMKNSNVIGTRTADSAGTNDWDFGTGTIVADVNQGDHVFVQLLTNSIGVVGSIECSRTTFSGWLLR